MARPPTAKALLRWSGYARRADGRRAHRRPHYVLGYESRFKEAVDRLARGRGVPARAGAVYRMQPSIEFRDLLKTACELGAKVLAAGQSVASRALPGGGRTHYRAREAERDQSYFLFATTPCAA